MFYYTLFLFVAFGSKLLLALVMIYLLLPTERSCDECDGETLLIRPEGGARLLGWLTRGRIQRRWCPRCSWYGLARVSRPFTLPRSAGRRAGAPPRNRTP
jgi:hypothetical protein